MYDTEPIVYCLLFTAYSILSIAYYLPPTAFLHTASYLGPIISGYETLAFGR